MPVVQSMTENLARLRAATEHRVGAALTDADYTWLEKSWIDRGSADAAMLRRCSALEVVELVGGKANSGGISIPYYRPGESRAHAYRVRVDTPDVTYDHGKRTEKAKYRAAPGSRNSFYFAPSLRAEWIEDPSLPIVLTEGEKKTLALQRLSWWELDGSEVPRFVAIGLSGVWNWRGTVGREPADNGGFHSVKGTIADFDVLPWEGRKVTIVFDANTRTNQSVGAARTELARHLQHERGALVHLVDLPSRVNGVDDLLALEGPAKVLAVLDRARESNIKKDKDAKAQVNQVLSEIQFCQSPEQKLYATVQLNGHTETWSLRSRAFESWLTRRLFSLTGSAPSAALLQETKNNCVAQADFQPPSTTVDLRVTGSMEQRVVYVDLGGSDWEQLRIDAEGWRPVKNEVRFRRSRGLNPLPSPSTRGAWGPLRKLCNADDDTNWILMVAWLVGALSPRGPYPPLAVQGEQGSAKSTTSRILRSLVDPATPLLRSVPRDERDLMIAAMNNWVICLDNLSGIQAWMSDALCRLATGGGFATRELHSDDEETLFEASRPCILNGIDDVAERPDLVDRCLMVTLPAIREESRRPESEVWAEFESVKPGVMGALVDAVSGALRCLDQVQLESYPRMADFTRWVCAAAIAGALPFSEDAFLEAYGMNRREAVSTAIEASPIASQVQRLLGRLGSEEWLGTAVELLDALNECAPESVRKLRNWPKAPNALTNRLRRVIPLLRQTGIECEFVREGHERTRRIFLKIKNPGNHRPHRPQEVFHRI